MIEFIGLSGRSQCGRIFGLSNGRSVCGFKAKLFDYEVQGIEAVEQFIAQSLSTLDGKTRVRIITNVDRIYQVENTFSRSDAISVLGHKDYSILVLFEKNISFKNWNIDQEQSIISARRILNDPKWVQEEDLTSELLDESESFFLLGNQIISNKKRQTIFKLTKLLSSEVTSDALALVLENMPLPCKIVTSLKVSEPDKSTLFFTLKRKKHTNFADPIEQEKSEANESVLREISLIGKKIFQLECHVVLYGSSEEEMWNKITELKMELAKIGDFRLEEKGAVPSLFSTQIGSDFHLGEKLGSTLFEKDSNLAPLLPVYVRGNGLYSKDLKTLLFHRNSVALDGLNIFDKSASNYSGYVVGKSGSGKSVFFNSLVRSQINDPSAIVIIADVLGSYKRLTQEVDGKIYNISIDKPSGIDPFQELGKIKSNLSTEMLLSFVESLLISEDETKLPFLERAEVEKALNDYLIEAMEPTLLDFFEKSGPFPRKKALYSWVEGNKAKLFRGTKKSENTQNVIYFNFEDLSSASNITITRSITAAILCRIMGIFETKPKDTPLIFFCDEAKFFVDSAYSSLSFLQKNVRKHNGAIWFAVQYTDHLMSGNDSSLLVGAEHRIIFTTDIADEEFIQKHQVTKEELAEIKFLEASKNSSDGDRGYRSFFLKNSTSGKIGLLALSDEEYLMGSTTPKDIANIQKVSEFFKIDLHRSAKVILALNDMGLTL